MAGFYAPHQQSPNLWSLAEEAVKAAQAEISELNERRNMQKVQLEELQAQAIKIGLELMKIQEEQNTIYSETLEAYRTVYGRKAQLSFGTAAGG